MHGKTISKLDTMSPLKTLARGYCITQKRKCIINSAYQLESGDEIDLRFSDGEKHAKVL